MKSAVVLCACGRTRAPVSRKTTKTGALCFHEDQIQQKRNYICPGRLAETNIFTLWQTILRSQSGKQKSTTKYILGTVLPHASSVTASVTIVRFWVFPRRTIIANVVNYILLNAQIDFRKCFLSPNTVLSTCSLDHYNCKGAPINSFESILST